MTPAETGKSPTTAKEWLDEIVKAQKDFSKWTTRAKKIERIYLDDRDEGSMLKRQYALLWANISVLQPAVYAKPPQPVVTRRFSDRDPVARAVSEVVERSLVTLFDTADVDTCMKGVRDNFLIVGQGTGWVRYVPTFEQREFELEDGTEPVEALADETLAFDFVHWSDFIRPRARRWEDLPWVARRVYPDDFTGEARFGKEKWDKAKDAAKKPKEGEAKDDRPCVYEIWSKRDAKVLWIAKDVDDFLDEKPPLYDLAGFFPCPRPAYSTLPTDSLEPVPDYVYYQDQAEEINKLTTRIGQLEDALKVVGFYAGGAEGEISTALETAFSADTGNKMVPVPAWSAFTQGGGASKMVDWFPVDQVIKVLQGCTELRAKLIDDVFQITGISDIIRGSSAPQETATAQSIKAQWGGIRIRDRQNELARFARDLTRIAAEIVAEKFQPETLWRLSGLKFPSQAEKDQMNAELQAQAQQAQMQAQQAMQQQQAPGMPGQPPHPPQAPPPPEIPEGIQEMLGKPTQEELVSLIQDDRMRSYRIDIETDSTIAADEEAEKASRQEFVSVLGQMLQQAMPVAQSMPELVPVMGESLLFLTRAYRTGRQLEDTIEQAMAAIEKKAKGAINAPPPPDPAMVKAENDANATQAKLELQARESQAKQQQAAQDSQAQIQLARDKAAGELMLKKQSTEANLAMDAQSIQQRQAMDQQKMAMQAQPEPPEQDAEMNAKLDALIAGMTQLFAIVGAQPPVQ